MKGLNKHAVSAWTAIVKKKQWELQDNFSFRPYLHLTELMESIFPPHLKPSQPVGKTRLSRGMHFLYCTQSNADLGRDGYSNYQAPTHNSESLFVRRMWVKGTLEFSEKEITLGDSLECRETINSVRTVGSSVFVNIDRQFYSNGLILREARTLVYTNRPFEKKEENNSSPGAASISNETSLRINLNPSQLLKYSMLTYNLHKIHFDREYCLEENLPNIIVQGPFMVTLILFWFERMRPDNSISSFTYKNLEPCFVDEYLDLSYISEENGRFRVTIENKDLGKKYLSGVVSV